VRLETRDRETESDAWTFVAEAETWDLRHRHDSGRDFASLKIRG